MALLEKPSNKSTWRIKTIPFRDPFAPVETNLGALLGAVLFIAGIVASIKIKLLFLIAVLGIVIGLMSILFRGRTVRKKWKKVVAICSDREWHEVLGAAGLNGGVRKTWAFQLLCVFELEGKKYTVTPAYWSTFISENHLLSFLEKHISADGKCQLWVNPKNPLQTELVANDVKDFILH